MNDHKFMDGILDQAQEQISSNTEVEAPLTEQVETQTSDEQHEDIAVKEALESKEEKKKPSIRDMAKKALKAETSQKEVQEKEEETEQVTDLEANTDVEIEEEAHVEEPAAEPIKPPVFWSAERKKLFEKAAPELQKVIADRELELQQQISRAAREGSNGSYEKRFYEDFESPEAANLHRAKLKAQGISDPIAELQRYRAWDRVVEADPLAVCADLLRKNGFSPHDLLNEANGVQREPNQYQDPRVDEAIKRADAAEREIQEFKANQEIARKAHFVNSFKEGLDSTGQKRKDFCELYSFQIDQAFQNAKAEYPMATDEQLLDHAYESVKAAVSQFHGAPAAPKPEVKPQPTKEERIANAKKASAAASKSFGGPNTGTVSQKPRLKGKNFSEKFDSAFEIAEARANSAH